MEVLEYVEIRIVKGRFDRYICKVRYDYIVS